MNSRFKHLKAIVFDWAGTMVDHGSRAPAIVFQEIFRQNKIVITVDQAREPMGMAKREHISAITKMPSVAAQWQKEFASPCGETEIDDMYEKFLPLQMATLSQHCVLIDGAAKIASQCRERGLVIGSSTGYTRELMTVVSAAAKEQGYEPDCVLCAEDAPRGRPAPYLLFEAAKRMDVFPMWNFVKVDDTPVGIEAGINAGCWTVGISRTGNCVGLSEEELNALSTEERSNVCNRAAERLRAAGAHHVIESVSDIMPILNDFDRKLDSGDLPNRQ